jgi:uncharacterized protein (DUF169 family)
MTDYQDVADTMDALLGLTTPPVAVAFVGAPPAGIAHTTKAAPSTCSFWRHAEQRVFYAAAPQHFNCEIGALVMGFDLPEHIMHNLGGVIEMMTAYSYLSPGESDNIPSVGGKPVGVVYGPLAQFPTAPSAVVLWLTPKQAMLYNEAAGSANWSASPERISGRPACAALPAAMHGKQPTLSLGCIGMRTFTQVADDRMLAVIPGDKLMAFVDALRSTAAANTAVLSIYETRKTNVGTTQRQAELAAQPWSRYVK